MTEQRKSLSNTSEAAVETKCILCRRYGHSMSSPLQWKREDAQRYVVGLIPSGGKVCQACRKDVSRLLSDSNFVPRWSKLKTEKYCSINNCDNSVFASLKSGIEEIEEIFATLGLESSCPITIPIPLCKHHYHLVYNTLKPTQTH